MSTPTKTETTENKKAAAAKAEDRKAIELALSAINKTYGEGTLMRMGEASKMTVSSVSTGSVAIDLALGVGGLPRGRIVEIYGPESSGKTTLCLSVIAEIQRQGGNAVFIDVEHALDPRYAKVVGVDLDNLLVSQLEGQMGDSTVGVQARMMSQAMRRLTAAISRTNCICIFTNQIREKIGVMFGNPETTPGGRALKFFSSVRIDIRRIGQIKEPTGKVIGNRTRVKVVKNKVAPPFTECEFDIMYSEGISRTGSVLDLGIEHKILEKKGAWIAHNGQLIGQGREAAKEHLLKNPKLMEELQRTILEKVQVTGGMTLGASGDAPAAE